MQEEHCHLLLLPIPLQPIMQELLLQEEEEEEVKTKPCLGPV